MKVVPYLNFPNSLEVLDFYKKLGAENVQILLGSDEMFAEMPEEQRPSNPSEFVMNAGFEVFGNVIYLSDTWNKTAVDHDGSNLCFTFDQKDEAEVTKVKDFFQHALDLGCTVEMPLGPSEWSELFGMFKDPFGITWMFSGE
ncbi:VOC family protein [Fundicoccus culcitae]|uniref:Glyoxalase/fosfomycin resistance/dioxygenase domain-containing protein n=1 Tax=Fundicoccus culcitae TaxID=2969821 RepID=A0ABY5P7I0_9LACT|nr:VOC family protein [Fundicoccus culcitae]UUX34689.1 hypothetical protein NRE15_03285 [Fundicoccus culcitae]